MTEIPMNENRLDRIERLLEGLAQTLKSQVERQAALTETVEIIAGMQKKNEESIEKLYRSVKAMERVAIKSAADFHIRLQALEDGQ